MPMTQRKVEDDIYVHFHTIQAYRDFVIPDGYMIIWYDDETNCMLLKKTEEIEVKKDE